MTITGGTGDNGPGGSLSLSAGTTDDSNDRGGEVLLMTGASVAQSGSMSLSTAAASAGLTQYGVEAAFALPAEVPATAERGIALVSLFGASRLADGQWFAGHRTSTSRLCGEYPRIDLYGNSNLPRGNALLEMSRSSHVTACMGPSPESVSRW